MPIRLGKLAVPVVAGVALLAVAVVSQRSSPPTVSLATKAQGVAPQQNVKRCSEMQSAEEALVSTDQAQRADLAKRTEAQPDAPGELQFSLMSPVTLDALRQMTVGLTLTQLSATFSGYIGATNLNSSFRLSDANTLEQDLTLWRQRMIRSLAEQASGLSPADRAVVDLLSKRIAGGELPLIAAVARGRHVDLSARLANNPSVKAVSLEEGVPPAWPTDHASQLARDGACRGVVR